MVKQLLTIACGGVRNVCTCAHVKLVQPSRTKRLYSFVFFFFFSFGWNKISYSNVEFKEDKSKDVHIMFQLPRSIGKQEKKNPIKKKGKKKDAQVLGGIFLSFFLSHQ